MSTTTAEMSSLQTLSHVNWEVHPENQTQVSCCYTAVCLQTSHNYSEHFCFMNESVQILTNKFDIFLNFSQSDHQPHEAVQ